MHVGIRGKLLFLVLILLVAFGLSAGIYFYVRAPIAKIESEQRTVAFLQTAFLGEALRANRLTNAPLRIEIDTFKSSVATTTFSFAQLEQLKVLPTLGPSVRRALTSIEKLKTTLDVDASAVLNSVTEVQSGAVGYYDPFSAYSLLDLTTDVKIDGDPRKRVIVVEIQHLSRHLEKLTDDLLSSVAEIDRENRIIGGTIDSVEGKSSAIALSVIIVLVGVTLLVALVLSNRIVRSVRSIEVNVAGMTEGDLTRSFAVETRDEIGRLSANLNRFIASLSGSLKGVQAASAENIRMKESLLVTTEQTSASTTEIGANAHSIDRQISTLDESLLAAGGAVSGIAGSIRGLNEQIQEQMAMVEESSASVTQMIASIDSVTKIAERRREASEQLVRTVTVGGEKMAATFEVVSAINESVDSIKEITGIIEALSAQTNLLAMNAAIEAAHAGDAGRGFSVVADEIRKLAEASAENSQEISKILKGIVERISEASASGEEMNSAFSEIDREVKELSSSLAEIYGNMSELKNGGDQILQAMSALSEVSVNVKGGSSSITENTRSIGETMATVQRISTEVRSGMGEIARGIKEISDAVANVLSIAERLGEQGELVNKELTRFKTV